MAIARNVSDGVPRCQTLSPTPWGVAQCCLPDGHSERHAFSPSEAVATASDEAGE